MSRRHPTLQDQLLHQWRRLKRNELARTLSHIKLQQKRQEKRAIFVKNYVQKSIDLIDRAEGRNKKELEPPQFANKKHYRN